MKIEFTERAIRDLKNLPARVQEQVFWKLERIRMNPKKYVKKLTDTDYYRLRIGEYRAILLIEDKIYVIRIAHRKKVYKMI